MLSTEAELCRGAKASIMMERHKKERLEKIGGKFHNKWQLQFAEVDQMRKFSLFLFKVFLKIIKYNIKTYLKQIHTKFDKFPLNIQKRNDGSSYLRSELDI